MTARTYNHKKPIGGEPMFKVEYPDGIVQPIKDGDAITILTDNFEYASPSMLELMLGHKPFLNVIIRDGQLLQGNCKLYWRQ